MKSFFLLLLFGLFCIALHCFCFFVCGFFVSYFFGFSFLFVGFVMLDALRFLFVSVSVLEELLVWLEMVE
jgi:hypothetical protein